MYRPHLVLKNDRMNPNVILLLLIGFITSMYVMTDDLEQQSEKVVKWQSWRNNCQTVDRLNVHNYILICRVIMRKWLDLFKLATKTDLVLKCTTECWGVHTYTSIYSVLLLSHPIWNCFKYVYLVYNN